MRYYIGLDVGTSGCKAAVVNDRGEVCARAGREYHFVFPRLGWVEMNPAIVWEKVCETLREIAAGGYRADYLAVSSIGESMVLLDSSDQILYNGINYLDNRGPEILDLIEDTFGLGRMQQITGLPKRIFFSLTRWLWLKEHEPEVIERTRKAFLFGDYITYRLTGERLIDPSSASKTWLLSAMDRQWSSEIAAAFDVPVDRFSTVVPTGTVAGRILPEMSEMLGLLPNLQVVVGVHDQCAATLGAGCIFPGDLAAGEGATESLNLVVERSSVTERFLKQDFMLEPYLLPDRFLVPVGQHTHGSGIRWFVDELGPDFGPHPAPEDGNRFAQAFANCAGDSGEVFCLPYLTRAHMMDSSNRSLGMFLGLEMGTTRAEMYRAMLEGFCFEARLSLEMLEEFGLKPEKIIAAGGCTKSDLYMQIKSDVLEQPIHILRNTDAGIQALAMICAVAAGDVQDYKEAVSIFSHISRTFRPEADYREKYRKYRKIQAAAKKLYEEI